jgi:hypothetical protein
VYFDGFATESEAISRDASAVEYHEDYRDTALVRASGKSGL